MHLEPYISTFGHHLRQRFGQRVRKLALHAGFTCPNRDGTRGRGGCTFCSVLSFNGEDPRRTVQQQLEAGKAATRRAGAWLAYFQAYTNTYAEVQHLQHLYDAAVAEADVVGLCVGTRPDCLPDATLDLLQRYHDQGLEVWLELGLQSAHDATLQRVRRGHDFAAYADAVRRARLRGLPVCTHLILGLPGETGQHMQQTLERVLDGGVQGLKLHPLLVVKGAPLAAAWRRGELELLSLDQYAALAAQLIRRTPRDVLYHRISATARPPTLRAPAWCAEQWPALTAIVQHLQRDGGQGSACGPRTITSSAPGFPEI